MAMTPPILPSGLGPINYRCSQRFSLPESGGSMAPARSAATCRPLEKGQFHYRKAGNRAFVRLIAVQYDAIVTRPPKARHRKKAPARCAGARRRRHWDDGWCVAVIVISAAIAAQAPITANAQVPAGVTACPSTLFRPNRLVATTAAQRFPRKAGTPVDSLARPTAS